MQTNGFASWTFYGADSREAFLPPLYSTFNSAVNLKSESVGFNSSVDIHNREDLDISGLFRQGEVQIGWMQALKKM